MKILLSIKNLKKNYLNKKIVKALKGVSLDLLQGEIISLLGVNGAGKTTLSSIIATLNPAIGGEILYDGKSIYDDINTYRYIIGFCPQAPNLNNELTVKQNLIFSAQYYGFSKQKAKDRFEELMKKYGLEEYQNFKPSNLSGGYRQRVSIVRALMHKPKLVILDEPTVGLDPHIRYQLWETIRNLKKEGVTVLLTTHYMDEAEVLSDRICILDKGLVRLIDTPENLKKIYNKGRLEEIFIQLMEEETV
jgi:ABC-2 type transport system ATP-binding protein